MDNYILAQDYNKANINDRLWYVMAESDLDTLLEKEDIGFGDKAYAIEEKTFHICGNDGKWYEM